MRQFPKILRKNFTPLAKLNSPQKIQDFLETLPFNFEQHGETCRSPLLTLEHNTAHCMEGALLAVAALWYHGHPPLLLDLRADAKTDVDHVVALFKVGKFWGALSKTNHGVLRYRDPLYRDVRELTMSYFHEYFLNTNGKKTLRAFSQKPFSLLDYEDDWLTSPDPLWELCIDLDDAPHSKIATPQQRARLRPASAIEIAVGKITEWRD